MTGLDRWIDFDKGDFIGREAALRENETATSARQQLVTLEVDATDADASGYEPVWQDGKPGRLHHLRWLRPHDRQEPGHGLVDRDLAAAGTELAVHIVGDVRACRVIAPRRTIRKEGGCAPHPGVRGSRSRNGSASAVS